MRLYDQNGHRKYLTPAERQNFIRASESALRLIRTFCGTLVHTGCRISEALVLVDDIEQLAQEVKDIKALPRPLATKRRIGFGPWDED